jgi:large subunit ribosomal protein L10e
MALRPGRTVRKKKRPYTRVSKKKPRKSYVTGVPYPRIHIFEMGNKDGKFKAVLYLVATEAVQIRDNALESARIVASKYLAKKLGQDGYFMKILVYPHQVLREHSIAMGAGADRYSQGMAHAFGRPSGIAVQTKVGQRIIVVRTKKAGIGVAKDALKRASSKISSRTRIEVEE